METLVSNHNRLGKLNKIVGIKRPDDKHAEDEKLLCSLGQNIDSFEFKIKLRTPCSN